MPRKSLDSFDRHIGEGTSFTYPDCHDPAAIAETADTAEKLQQLLTVLSPDSRMAIEMRFFNGKGYRQIGNQLRVSRETARQLVNRGLVELRRKRAFG